MKMATCCSRQHTTSTAAMDHLSAPRGARGRPAMRAFLSEQDLRAIEAEMRARARPPGAIATYGFVAVTSVTTSSGICLFQAEG